MRIGFVPHNRTNWLRSAKIVVPGTPGLRQSLVLKLASFRTIEQIGFVRPKSSSGTPGLPQKPVAQAGFVPHNRTNWLRSAKIVVPGNSGATSKPVAQVGFVPHDRTKWVCSAENRPGAHLLLPAAACLSN